MRAPPLFVRRLLLVAAGLFALVARAEPMDFNLPAQSASSALLDFSRQTKIEVFFSFDALRERRSTAVVGRFEPEVALKRLLEGTGFAARPNGNGKYVVTPTEQPTGSIKGKVVGPDGTPVNGARVEIRSIRTLVRTDAHGDFDFVSVSPGRYILEVAAQGFQPQSLPPTVVEADRVSDVGALTIQPVADPAQLAPFVVEGQRDRPSLLDPTPIALPPRSATGNLDLPRTQDDALTFTIYDRARIARSGVVNLNEYLRRELLDSNAATLPPEQNGRANSFASGSANLALRGFSQTDETIIMLNGRRLPEFQTSGGSTPQMPDVNFIPISLVQEVDVLPVSAASLYNGNPVGGVINIILRPAADLNVTEVTTTYTNALHRYDAPGSSLSLTHMQTLLGGALHVSLNASLAQAVPPTEAELHYRQAHDATPALFSSIHRATPNIRSVDGSPLFGTGTSSVTSVAPGADGSGGLAAFTSREGVRDLGFFQPPGGFATSTDSIDYPYGRQQRRDTYFGSVVYDIKPWLQLGLDGTLSHTTVNRGYDVIPADFTLAADSPFNPFKKDVVVSLNETAPKLGQDYSEARLEFASAVFGLLFKLPREWKVSFDAQYAHNLTKYRGLADVDRTRWQQLVDDGKYNPLRDTQVVGPPQAFYDQVLIYQGGPNRFTTLGNYGALDVATRATNGALLLPTGRAELNVGGDYRRTYLAPYRERQTYADGSDAGNASDWSGRTLQRYSAFAELRAPLVPEARLPMWLHKLEIDAAVRYVAADSARESYVAPTVALKAELTSGLSFRGSFTTSNRYPTPQMSRQVFAPSNGGAPGLDYESISDPRRNGETYNVVVNENFNPILFPESAVTQTAGLLFQRGSVHRVRATLDFVDTRKTNELVFLDNQTVISLESYFPDRVQRAPLAPGDTHAVGQITSIVTSAANLAWRHSQDWNATGDYTWTECFGGRLDLYGRLLYFQSYKLARQPGSPIVDELRHPDGDDLNLLRYRANFGVSWSNREQAYGLDGQYFHSRVLPAWEQTLQGHAAIRPFWQFDAYTQREISHWLPWGRDRVGLSVQVRVNNIFRSGFPRFAADPSGVQAYGDWRDRTYSLSLTATF